jgi:hypothetical protein
VFNGAEKVVFPGEKKVVLWGSEKQLAISRSRRPNTSHTSQEVHHTTHHNKQTRSNQIRSDRYYPNKQATNQSLSPSINCLPGYSWISLKQSNSTIVACLHLEKQACINRLP